jgi:hypothetical protein
MPKGEPEDQHTDICSLIKGFQIKKIPSSENQKSSILVAVSFLSGKYGYSSSITMKEQKQQTKKYAHSSGVYIHTYICEAIWYFKF